MSSGYSAVHTVTMDEKEIDKIVGGLISELKKKLDWCGLTLIEFFEFVEFYNTFPITNEFNPEEIEELEEVSKNLYETIQKEFRNKTNLELFLNYHNSDEYGSTYDDVNGYFWEIGGAYTHSPAGKKLKYKLKNISFVVQG